MKLPILLVFLGATSTAVAQVELKINANANYTWVPDFKNRIYIVDGFIVPDEISISNARNPPVITETTSETRPSAGFHLEAELGKKLNDRWKLSFALGCMQMSYNHVSYIAQSFYMNDFKLLHGDSRFTYISARPANVSFTNNRFSFQAGPVLSYLVGKKYTNAVVIYEKNTFDIIGAFFEEERRQQKFLMGAHFNTRFSVGRRVAIMLGSQYFFDAKAFQTQFGVSYTLVRGAGK